MENEPPASDDQLDHNLDLEGDGERQYTRPRDMTLRTADGKCLNCCDINFETFFSLTASSSAIASISLEYAIIASDYCPFCKLLMDAEAQLIAPRKPSSFRGQQRITFYFERVYNRGVWSDTTFKKPSGTAMKVTVRPAPYPFSAPEIYFNIYPIFKSIVDDRLHSGRFVDPTRADLKVAEQWVTSCDALHGRDCAATSYLVTQQDLWSFRVIDVHDMCVKSERPSCRYVALSYVWGNVASLMLSPSNIDVLLQKGSLNAFLDQIPQTIRDAIHVVKEIGERYLWVDCLCILQADEKTAQIAAMDQIFGSACLTIVAACGVDASVGLLGVHQNSRCIEHLTWTITEQLTLAVALQNPNGITNAQWSSRGWTLQEALLGKRFLIFRDGQILWQCRHGMEFEDTLAQNKAYPYEGLSQLPQKRMINLMTRSSGVSPHSALLRSQEFKFYVDIAEDYTRRHLTKIDDILSAFGGLSKIFEVMFGAPMLCGLPEIYCDVALLWQPKIILKRRDVQQKSFPSWSWAGWIGEISYPEVEAEERENQDGVVPLIRWFISSSHPDIPHQSQFRPLNITGIGIDERSLRYEKTLSTCMWFPFFEDPQSPSIPTDIQLRYQSVQGHHLGFWTSAAYLSIVSKSDVATTRDQNIESRHPPLEYQIRNKFGYVLGHVTMTGLSPTQTQKEQHEFIVVSGAQALGYNTITGRCKFSTQPAKWEMYNVMLVEWDEYKKIAYRVGLGRVLKSAWITGDPKRKFVVLG